MAQTYSQEVEILIPAVITFINFKKGTAYLTNDTTLIRDIVWDSVNGVLKFISAVNTQVSSGTGVFAAHNLHKDFMESLTKAELAEMVNLVPFGANTHFSANAGDILGVRWENTSLFISINPAINPA